MEQLKPWWPAVIDREWGYEDAIVAGAAFAGALKRGLSLREAERVAEQAGYDNLFAKSLSETS